jgi:hypothetical protein
MYYVITLLIGYHIIVKVLMQRHLWKNLHVWIEVCILKIESKNYVNYFQVINESVLVYSNLNYMNDAFEP